MKRLPSSLEPNTIYPVHRGDGEESVGKVHPEYDHAGALPAVTLYTNNRARRWPLPVTTRVRCSNSSRTTPTATLFYRDAGEWVQVEADEDHPTIYERNLTEVDQDDAERALQFWDVDIKKDQILPSAGMYQ